MLQLPQHKKKIGLHEYRVTVLDALQGRSLFVRLARILGLAFDGFDSKDVEASIPRFFARAAGSMSEEDMTVFCDTLATFTDVSGGAYSAKAPRLSDVFATHFAGNYPEMVAWLAFALEVNFGGFFGRTPGSGASTEAAPAVQAA